MASMVSEEPQYLQRTSPFSFVCTQDCSDCCKNKRIQVNPYEIARLSSCLKITTTEFIHVHTEQGVFLKHSNDGSCIFHSKEGCSVHPDRPLVCRLYPLGVHQSKQKNERFTLIQFPSFCEGVLSNKGTVESYLYSQDAKSYFDASDHYSSLLEKVISSLNKASKSQPETPLPEWVFISKGANFSEEYPRLLDIDYVLQSEAVNSEGKALDAREKMHLHITAIKEFLKAIDKGETP